MSDEQEPADLQRIAEVLNRHQVDYILVGGMVGRLHGPPDRPGMSTSLPDRRGQPRPTRRGSARASRRHSRRIWSFRSLMMAQQTHHEALARRQFGNWTTDAGELDTALFIGTHDQPITYDQLYEHATRANYNGVPLVVASLGDIVAAKTIADRDKDHDALPELKRLLDEQRDAR